jgi:type I restriction enzyme R subunit
MTSNFTSQTAQLKIDERNHVEKPLLDQLAGLKWEILDLNSKQHPGDSFRQSFTEVVMPPVLREQIKVHVQAPTVEKARAWLKENGQLLEEAV